MHINVVTINLVRIKILIIIFYFHFNNKFLGVLNIDN